MIVWCICIKNDVSFIAGSVILASTVSMPAFEIVCILSVRVTCMSEKSKYSCGYPTRTLLVAKSSISNLSLHSVAKDYICPH